MKGGRKHTDEFMSTYISSSESFTRCLVTRRINSRQLSMTMPRIIQQREPQRWIDWFSNINLFTDYSINELIFKWTFNLSDSSSLNVNMFLVSFFLCDGKLKVSVMEDETLTDRSTGNVLMSCGPDGRNETDLYNSLYIWVQQQQTHLYLYNTCYISLSLLVYELDLVSAAGGDGSVFLI